VGVGREGRVGVDRERNAAGRVTAVGLVDSVVGLEAVAGVAVAVSGAANAIATIVALADADAASGTTRTGLVVAGLVAAGDRTRYLTVSNVGNAVFPLLRHVRR